MADSDVLLTIAEVAVAFAGFASLVGILGQRTSADDPRVLGVRMRGMLLSSLLVVMFSLFPILLDRLGLDALRVWTLASLALLASTAAYLGWLLAALRAMSQANIRPNRVQRFLIVPTLVLTLGALVAVLIVNAFRGDPGIYLLALLLLLFQSAFAFCLIVFSFLPRDAVGPGKGRTDDG